MTHPLYAPTLRLTSFEALAPLERGAVLRSLTEVLCRANALYFRRVRMPLLYESGVRYVDTDDQWRDAPAVLAARGGDCKDLTAWRVAELRARGRHAHPRILMITDDATPNQFLYHVLVEHGAEGSGQFEDPSKLLGM